MFFLSYMKGVSKVFEGRKCQQQKFRLKDLDPDSEFEKTPKISLHFFLSLFFLAGGEIFRKCILFLFLAGT